MKASKPVRDLFICMWGVLGAPLTPSFAHTAALTSALSPRGRGMRLCSVIYVLLISMAFISGALAGTVIPDAAARTVDFEKDIQPLFAKNCYGCHGPKKQKGEYRLDVKTIALRKGETQPIVPGHSAESLLIQLVAGVKADKIMPPDGDGDPLSREQIGLLRAWIDQGALWPEKPGDAAKLNRLDWWSLKPIRKPVPPAIADAKNPIDAFVLAKLKEKALTASAPADRTTLLRRLYFDLTGLPPTPKEVSEFIADNSPDAYEKRVDSLLASPRYGERWARYWMDAVHFAETHGHDQDRVRPNAWPYRDYLIESFNRDTPYARFVQEQLAADVLFPDQTELTPALGFIAAGPWDESSLRDIREDSMCRQIGQYIDRDDMVMTTMSTFASSTVHCARCHDHKFDAISQNDYYAMQSVFAGIGRGDRPFDADASTSRRRRSLKERIAILEHNSPAEVDPLVTPDAIQEAVAWSAQFRELQRDPPWTPLDPDAAAAKSESVLTKQPDLSVLASGPVPESDIYTVTAHTAMPSVTAVKLEIFSDDSLPAKGPGRAVNGNMHLTEFKVMAASVDKPGEEKPVVIERANADFNQQDWTIAHAIDGKNESAWGIFPQVGKPHWAVFKFKTPVAFEHGAVLKFVLEQQHGGQHLIGRFRLSLTAAPVPMPPPPEIASLLGATPEAQTPEQRRALTLIHLKQKLEKQVAGLPPQRLVYAGARDFVPDASHKPLAKPRDVFVLRRGDITKPGDRAQPGALNCVAGLPGRFELPAAVAETDEGLRRAALARWLTDPANVLVWRSAVNRIWHYHFGRGIVSSLNDFGHMGSLPSHPELLDWLAATFLESGGSFKQLHRLIVTSSTYKQSSRNDSKNALTDADNQFLWRMERSRMDAECVRDAILQITGKLDLKMGGPSMQYFKMTPGPHVTPVVDYTKFDWDSPGAGRRSVYRFTFRTLPDPFMDALDCADASQLTAVRNVSITPLQALAMLNNTFVLHHSELLAQQLSAEGDLSKQIQALYRLLFYREPTPHELEEVLAYATKHGMVNACRVLLNSNEFMFID